MSLPDEKVRNFTPSFLNEDAIHMALNLKMRLWDWLLNEENWPFVKVQTPTWESSAPLKEPRESNVPIGVPLPPRTSLAISLPFESHYPHSEPLF